VKSRIFTQLHLSSFFKNQISIHDFNNDKKTQYTFFLKEISKSFTSKANFFKATRKET